MYVIYAEKRLLKSIVVVFELLLKGCREEAESYKNLYKYFLNGYNREELLLDLYTCFPLSNWVMFCYFLYVFYMLVCALHD
jgi:hypothetical protein